MPATDWLQNRHLSLFQPPAWRQLGAPQLGAPQHPRPSDLSGQARGGPAEPLPPCSPPPREHGPVTLATTSWPPSNETSTQPCVLYLPPRNDKDCVQAKSRKGQRAGRPKSQRQPRAAYALSRRYSSSSPSRVLSAWSGVAIPPRLLSSFHGCVAALHPRFRRLFYSWARATGALQLTMSGEGGSCLSKQQDLGQRVKSCPSSLASCSSFLLEIQARTCPKRNRTAQVRPK